MAEPTTAPAVADEPAPTGWNQPSLTLKWGPYFPPDPEDENKTVATTVAAKNAGIVTTRMAVEKVARIFGVENVDAVLDDLEDEQEKNDAREIEKTGAEAEALHSVAASVSGAKPGGDRAGGGSKPPKPPSG